MSALYLIARLLVILGSLNYLFIALGAGDILHMMFDGIGLTKAIFIIIGICGLIALVEFIQARLATPRHYDNNPNR